MLVTTHLHSSASVRHREERLNVYRATDAGSSKDTSDTGSISSLGTTADSADKLHAAYLEVVYGLSSDVSLKKNSTTLNM